MPVIIDIGALVRPPFTAAEFTATKWDTNDDKAKFANDLCRFMAADFKLTLFTDRSYRRLANTFGHIAHYDRHGFVAEFFNDLRGKVDFLEQTLSWQPRGDPAWTYSDVERAVRQRLRACGLLAAYRQRRAAEIEAAERDLLRQLHAKYGDARAPATATVLHCPPPAKPSARGHRAEEQSSLF